MVQAYLCKGNPLVSSGLFLLRFGDGSQMLHAAHNGDCRPACCLPRLCYFIRYMWYLDVHLYRTRAEKVPKYCLPLKREKADPRIMQKNCFRPLPCDIPATRPQLYVYIPFLKEGIEETYELALFRQNRALPNGPCLFQKKLAIEIHSSVGERLSELSTH